MVGGWFGMVWGSFLALLSPGEHATWPAALFPGRFLTLLSPNCPKLSLNSPQTDRLLIIWGKKVFKLTNLITPPLRGGRGRGGAPLHSTRGTPRARRRVTRDTMHQTTRQR